jgi:hypothetical protein
MPYTLVQGKTVTEYRQIYIDEYCNVTVPIVTLDGIHVKFYPERFDHAFFESQNWEKGDKSIFSQERAERILWIKDALTDASAVLKLGWDKYSKSYSNDRRVAIVKGDYVVIIDLQSPNKGKFNTAYIANNSIGKILGGPDWPI